MVQTEIDALVTEYQHDRHRPREKDALTTLQKVASLVKPIMRQRNWRVGTLCEFYPEQTNLLGLNVNRGQKICLRLRYPGDERQFLPVEEVVDTMLHELCHNVHGPHNEHFHALWNQLRDEHESLLRKGYTGEGFLSEGKRLGGSGRIPLDEARRRARAAAEKRQILTAGSGQRLGGTAVTRGVDIRRVIADAAQRRITVTKGCASGTDQGRKLAEDVDGSKGGFRTKAEEDDANDRAIMQIYIDLVQEEEREKYGESYVPPSESNPAGMRAAMSPPPPQKSGRSGATMSPPRQLSSRQAKPSQKLPFKSPPVPVGTKPKIKPEPKPDIKRESYPISDDDDNEDYNDTWTCPICTLNNPSTFLCCDACTTERPEPASMSRPREPTSNPTPKSSSTTSSTTDINRNAFKPRLPTAKSIASIEAQASQKPAKPLGWLCHVCGTFMESEWWTCAECGTMKQAS